VKPRPKVSTPLAAFIIGLTVWANSSMGADASAQTCDVSTYPLSSPTVRFTDNGDDSG
jgi:hypothetical protein